MLLYNRLPNFQCFCKNKLILQVYIIFQEDFDTRPDRKKSVEQNETVHKTNLKQEFKDLLKQPKVDS